MYFLAHQLERLSVNLSWNILVLCKFIEIIFKLDCILIFFHYISRATSILYCSGNSSNSEFRVPSLVMILCVEFLQLNSCQLHISLLLPSFRKSSNIYRSTLLVMSLVTYYFEMPRIQILWSENGLCNWRKLCAVQSNGALCKQEQRFYFVDGPIKCFWKLLMTLP